MEIVIRQPLENEVYCSFEMDSLKMRLISPG